MVGLMLVLVFAALSAGLTGCAKPEADSGKKQVGVSFYLLADLARKICGEKMEVVCFMPPGTDVHGWEPTPRKVLQMTEADAFLLNGAGLEPWTGKVLPLLEKRNVPVFEAARCVQLSGHHECCGHEEHEAHEEHEGHEEDEAHEEHAGHEEDEAHEEHTGQDCGHDHAEGGADPHIWLSIKNVELILVDLKAFFCELDPENADYYEANLRKSLAECGTLDAEFQAVTKELPVRKLVVAHRAFEYLCRDYQLEQVALEGYGAYSDPSPAQMVKIMEFIRANHVPVIYAASSESSKGADAIARETGVKVGVLHPLGTLTPRQIEDGADYFSVMRENLEALKLLRTQPVSEEH